MTDVVDCARAFVRADYPQASAAFLGGSAASGRATETSDLDILVVLPGEWSTTAFVQTTTHNGRLVEAFVYGPDALQLWLDKGRDDARPVLDRLIGSGVSLIEGDIADELVSASRATLAAGPAPIDRDQLRVRRYSLSALVDDLEDAADSGTLRVLMATAWREAAELALRSMPAWVGTGKWLLRELRANQDPFGLAAWVDSGADDHAALAGMCRAVLDSVGGYLQDGFIRGEKPSSL
ncbi:MULTISPECIES: nucleotidyltransferase domain-containing protein [unclassified Microbacterium]|uniref:nucleotidyltransferase domain-containing protein n=1 Tax=Microbacterium TaxID=33882 RepID=UPI003B9DCAF9